MTTDDFDRVVARERALHRGRRLRRARTRLRLHAWVFVAVNLGLLAAWATQAVVFGHGHPAWFLPVTVGWGIGLLVHAVGIGRLRRRVAGAPPRTA